MEGETFSAEEAIRDPSTSVSHLFAVIRQWDPDTQGSIAGLVRAILDRG
jgi:hypothetical protein